MKVLKAISFCFLLAHAYGSERRAKREILLRDFFGRFDDLWQSALESTLRRPGSRSASSFPGAGVITITSGGKNFNIAGGSKRVTTSRQFYDELRNMFELPVSDAQEPQSQDAPATTSYTVQAPSKAQNESRKDLLHAMVSLGLLGDTTPTHNSNIFRLSNIFPEFSSTRASGWWTGPNVCITKRTDIISGNETATNATDSEEQHVSSISTDTQGLTMRILKSSDMSGRSAYTTSCKSLPDAFICTTDINDGSVHKQYHVEYRCCHGWALDDAKQSCSKALELKDIEAALQALGLNVFLDDVRQAGILDMISGNNVTIFAVDDEALQNAGLAPTNVVEGSAMRFDPSSVDVKTAFLSHIVGDIHASSSLQDEQILTTMADTPVRANIFLSTPKIVTANCARILTADSYYENGVIHVVDRVLSPVRRNVLEILRSDDQFSRLVQLIESDEELRVLLESAEADVTLFAPSNDALQRYEEEGNFFCPEALLRAHMLQYVLCGVVPQDGRVATKNVLGTRLVLSPIENATEGFTVQDIPVNRSDIMATNGVIHVLDGVIVPEEANPASEVLNASLGLSQAAEAFNQIDIDQEQNVTIFAPSNRAFTKVADVIKNLTSEQLQQVVLFHVANGRFESNELTNGLVLRSQDAVGTSLNVHSSPQLLFGRSVSVNCASVIHTNTKACGAIIHEIDRVLIPPTNDVIGVLENTGQHAKLLELIRSVDLESVLRQAESITVLAPSDEAIAKSEATLATIAGDKDKVVALLKTHVVKNMMCCNSIPRDSFFQIRRYINTLESNTRLVARRSMDGAFLIGGAEITECDQMATNGNVFTIDEVIIPLNV